MTKDNVLALLRHLLTFGGGFVAQAGYASGDEVTAASSAVLTLIGLVWSIIDKRNRA
jgi:hypothetical protein